MDQRAAFFHALALLANSRERFVVSQETLGHARSAWAASQGTDNPRQMRSINSSWGSSTCGTGISTRPPALTATLQMTERIGEGDYRTRCLAYLSILHRLRGQAEQARHMALAAWRWPQRPVYLVRRCGQGQPGLAGLARPVRRPGAGRRPGCPGMLEPNGHALSLPLAGGLAAAGNDPQPGLARRRPAVCPILIDPRQQPLRDPLAAILEDAITAGEKGLPKQLDATWRVQSEAGPGDGLPLATVRYHTLEF